MWLIRRGTAVVLATLLFGLVLGQGAANAATTATFVGTTLTVSSDAAAATVSHDAGGTIHVFEGAVEVPVSGGPATLTNTDTIDVTMTAGSGSTLTIDGSAGLFAPGATLEGSGQSEIEFGLEQAGTGNTIRFRQPGAADTIHVFDLNGDGDDDYDPFYTDGCCNGDRIVYEGQGGDDTILGAYPGCTARGIRIDILGGSGNDHLGGNWLVEGLLSGGEGDDHVDTSCNNGPGFIGVTNHSVYGGPGDDTITGSPGAETLRGNTGADVINAGGGTDLVRGARGADEITGGTGTDRLLGGGANDTIHATDGTGGNDTVNGNAGVNTCDIDSGDTATNCQNLTTTAAQRHGTAGSTASRRPVVRSSAGRAPVAVIGR
jgi:Ca2+-binding RTX toxin-like protein